MAVTAPGTSATRRAVFLDKDGTLIDDVPFNVDPTRIRLAPRAGRALRILADAGYRLLVVSNQPGVALGYFDEAALRGVERRVRRLLLPFGVVLDDWYWCMHAPGRGCGCRKPAPGLLRRAGREHGFDLTRSWVAGDILDDVEAGRAAGCRTVLVDGGGETEWELSAERLPHHRVPNLLAAAERIVRSPVTPAWGSSNARAAP